MATRKRTDSSDGKRWEPVLRPLVLEPDNCELPLTTTDVLVVTGGARRITAECALRLARESGARLAIFGLSEPTADDEIVSNLEILDQSQASCTALRETSLA